LGVPREPWSSEDGITNVWGTHRVKQSPEGSGTAKRKVRITERRANDRKRMCYGLATRKNYRRDRRPNLVIPKMSVDWESFLIHKDVGWKSCAG